MPQHRNRILACGRPGTEKTGALAAVVNSGRYRVAMLDFASNLAPLHAYVDPKFKDRVNILRLRDKVVFGDSQPVTHQGSPTAFRIASRCFEGFKGNLLGSGEEADWGPVTDWGPDTILAYDDLTQMGEAAFRRLRHMMGRTLINTRIQDYGVVQKELSNYFYLVESVTACNIYCISHLKMIGPKLLEVDDKAGITSEVVEELNDRMVNLIPTRLFPTLPGQDLAQNIAGQFDTALLFEVEQRPGTKARNVIRTRPTAHCDVKVPADVPDPLPAETGLLTIYTALQGDK